MAINPNGAFNSALSLFCSLFQDMNPADLPEGLSPDNQDLVFLPGSAATRPALQRLIDSIGTQQILSAKEFPLPNGDILNVFLDSQGNIRTRDVISGGLALVANVTPGVQFKAETAFQKQWYAFYSQTLAAAFSSNPFVGVDVPRYYDGTNFWRVTQDAPGAPPQANDDNNVVNILASAGGALMAVTGGIAAGVAGVSQVGNIVTVNLNSVSDPGLLQPGDKIVIAGVGVAGYNGTFTVLSTITPTLTFEYYNPTAGLAASGGGTIASEIARINLSTNEYLANGSQVTIAGVGVGGYNGTWAVRKRPATDPVTANYCYVVLNVSGLAASGGGTLTPIGNIVAGIHSGVLMFKSANGALTAPSLPFQWTAAGGKRVVLSQLAIGPAGTVQRVLAFTEAAGSAYSYLTPAIIPSTSGLPVTAVVGTIVYDNTSTSATLDFTDVQLAAGTPIDQPGNDLFQQIVLAPCLGVCEYRGSSRMAWWGEINNIKNLLNMGFDGGYVGTMAATPPGWIGFVANMPGSSVLVNNPGGSSLGFAYQMTAAGNPQDAGILQGAYQDYYGAPILEPSKQYIFRMQAQQVGALAGNFVAAFVSATSGTLATATIAASTLPASMGWVTKTFSLATPASIPADTQLQIYLANVTNGAVITIDEVEIIDASQPVLAQQMRVSYINNPFGYDDVTGIVGIDSTYSITGAFNQRGYLYILTDESLFQTQNNGVTEPDGWSVSEVARACGCAGPNAVDDGEGVAFWAGKYGHRFFSGGNPTKLSQEIQPTWDTINWDAGLAIWLVNDPVQKIIYIGLPTGSFVSPNVLYPMSYRSVNTAYEVPDPLHISYSGRMICSDLSRKSTKWNVTAPCGALMTTSLVSPRQMVFGSGNAQAPGVGVAFGNLYTLNPLKYTDDDYGVIASYYVTYAHWNHDTEQNVPILGLHRKLYTYLSAFITGIGNIQITPLVDALGNPYPATPQYQLSQSLTHDLEWGLNISGDRVFFKVAVTPLPGTTDAAFNLQHLVVAGRMDKVFPVRGAIL